MNPAELHRCYQELQAYVGWTEADAEREQAVAGLLKPYLSALVDDFYSEMARHPKARGVFTGREQQVERLKGSLVRWLGELLSGPYDQDYVVWRWRVGLRHVETGLDQVYTNVALSRIRSGLVQAPGETSPGDRDGLVATIKSLNKLIDLDLAEIEDAYQAEHLARQQRTDRLAAIGQVAGGVAHELRNPLNEIKTSVYYLLTARSASPEKTVEHLCRVEQHVGVADGAITTLSNFARMPIPDLRPFSVERCIREALETNAVGQNIQMVFDFPPSLPRALGDHDQLRIVFANLIRDAREAMPNGGTAFDSRSLLGKFGGNGRDRHWRRHHSGESEPRHGTAVLDQATRHSARACLGAGHSGQEQGNLNCRQRTRERKHIHCPAERRSGIAGGATT